MITRLLYALPILLFCWVGILAAVMLFTNDAPAALVLGPVTIPDTAAIVATPKIGISLSSDDPQFVASLYKNGAWLVLPAGLFGCAG